MHILKFGGTSVANSVNIKKTVDIVNNHPAGKKFFVVSALSGTTDALLKAGELAEKGDVEYRQILTDLEQKHLDCVRELLPVSNQSNCLSMVKQYFNDLESICEGIFILGELSLRSKDKIASHGELLSSKIISAYLKAGNISHTWVDSGKLIKTDSQFTRAQVDTAATKSGIEKFLFENPSDLYLAPGFIATDQQGHTTTIGRGGSDYTAALFAAATNAEALEIWTDVSGMMTADPRWVANASPLAEISYQEAMELSHFGAKVIYPPTIQPAMQKKIPVWIKNTFEPEAHGTLIRHETPSGNNPIRGITSISNISLVSLEGSGMIGIPGFSKRLFEALANEKINVILITQGSSEHSICVGLHAADGIAAAKAINAAFQQEIDAGKVQKVTPENSLSIIALVGDHMKSHTGISGQMFSALGKNGINVRAIAQGSSEKNISAVISSADVKKAVNVLHEAFFEEVRKQLNLFISGSGNVGRRLLAQLDQQLKYLSDKLKLQVRVVGLTNSRKMVFNEKGIDLSQWEELLRNGEDRSLEKWVSTISNLNLRNTIFVDITASEEMASIYDELLRRSIAIVACNKIAASSSYSNYRELKDLAGEFNTQFLFETNVGAGLPVISTLNDLIRSGDRITRIEAVLSGTLNYVFNNYDGSRPFAEIVREAQEQGYTEPDPRLDLSGQDVMRKILILARESGWPLEMSDIGNNSFLPASCMEGDVENFYAEMQKHAAHFKNLVEEANKASAKLKYVAEFEEGKAKVGLRHIPDNHDFYHLYGKDNIVLFYTARYAEQPLVVKGAGAGADVTASGVFADIIKVTGQ